MALPSKNNQLITLEEASIFTQNFRKDATADAIKGGLFWKEYIEKIIDQPDCVALRYYYGQDESGKPLLVLVGVDKDGHDITKGAIAEVALPCPPFCDDPNSLNS